MYTIKVDPHTHTLFSGHAFSTIGENAIEAGRKGLEGIGMTDHYGERFLPVSANGNMIFPAAMNMDAFPREIQGVRVLAGTEVDIIDKQGHLFGWNTLLHEGPLKGSTQLEGMLKTRDIAIASYHGFEGEAQVTREEGTQMYVNVLLTPGIHILGHIGRPNIPFDIQRVTKQAKDTGKMIEINNHSFNFGDEIKTRCKNIALACKKEGTYIVVSSDAHIAYQIGDFTSVLDMLKEIEFPQRLIANESVEKLLDVANKANKNQGFVKVQMPNR